jgi:phosphoribosylanthranilate isomerase
VIAEGLIAEIAAQAPPPVATFLLTSLQEATGIIDQQRRCGVNTIQLCDAVSVNCHRELRAKLPGISLVQVIHVTGPESIDEAIAVSTAVDAILLDSGNQKLAVKELGGTGRRHDWQISRAICEAVEAPVFLAGGLNADNVREAIAEVRPFGLDVCSGVRVNGRLDLERLSRFFEAIGQHQFA